MNTEYIFVKLEITEPHKDISTVENDARSLCDIFGFRLSVLRQSEDYFAFEIAYPHFHFLESDFSAIVKSFALLNGCLYVGSYIALL